MRRMVQSQGVYRALASAYVALSLLATATWSQTLTWLGDFTPTQVSNTAVVVGYRSNNSGVRIFRWSQQTGLQEIASTLAGKSRSAAVSDDGDIVWGGYEQGYFRWIHSSEQLELFSNLGGWRPYNVKDVSADGSIAVGEGYYYPPGGAYNRHALYVSAASGLIAWGRGSFACGLEGVSDDGRVAAGWDYYYAGIWVLRDNQLQKVDTRPVPMLGGIARSVSADGRYVGGSYLVYDYDAQQYRSYGCIWELDTSQDRPVATPRYTIEGYGVPSMSADASKCLCVAGQPNSLLLALWFPHEGRLRALRHPELSRIENITMSRNGRYVVGTAINRATGNREAFLWDISVLPEDGDVNGDGCVDDADLLAVLFAFGNTGSNLPEDLNGDNTVDDADLLEVLFNFGSGC